LTSIACHEDASTWTMPQSMQAIRGMVWFSHRR
jgi:hypothetical protein